MKAVGLHQLLSTEIHYLKSLLVIDEESNVWLG